MYNIPNEVQIETLRVSLFCVALVYRLESDRHWCFFMVTLTS